MDGFPWWAWHDLIPRTAALDTVGVPGAGGVAGPYQKTKLQVRSGEEDDRKMEIQQYLEFILCTVQRTFSRDGKSDFLNRHFTLVTF